jgi:hypothetical protein
MDAKDNDASDGNKRIQLVTSQQAKRTNSANRYNEVSDVVIKDEKAGHFGTEIHIL